MVAASIAEPSLPTTSREISALRVHAHLARREYRAELKGELRTFRCIACEHETEMTVKD